LLEKRPHILPEKSAAAKTIIRGSILVLFLANYIKYLIVQTTRLFFHALLMLFKPTDAMLSA
jgi:hypothetical protein